MSVLFAALRFCFRKRRGRRKEAEARGKPKGAVAAEEEEERGMEVCCNSFYRGYMVARIYFRWMLLVLTLCLYFVGVHTVALRPAAIVEGPVGKPCR